MSLGLLDLSLVTRRLIKQLTDCTTATRIWDEPGNLSPGSPFVLKFTEKHPDDVSKLPHCQVSLYLFHVAADKFYRNTYPDGGRARRIPGQPLGLTLYYLLSAHSKADFDAQQAMSIALKCFHEHHTLSAMAPMDGSIHEFTLTLEPQTVDEVARLWQSLTAPLRLSAVYRVSVFFLEPEDPPRTPGLVIKPVIEFEHTPGAGKTPGVGILPDPPAPFKLTATVTAAGLATVTKLATVAGQVFSAAMEVQIGGHKFQVTTTNPPEAGRFYVVSATRFRLRFPAGVPTNLKGQYLLHVRIPGSPEATVTLVIP